MGFKSQQAIDKTVFCGVIFVLVFTQLFFGGVHVWAYTLAEVVIFVLAGLLMLKHQWRRVANFHDSLLTNHNVRPSRLIDLHLNIFILLLISLVFIQLIPLPPRIIEILSPGAYHIKKSVQGLGSLSGHSGDHHSWMNLTIYSFPTWKELMKLLTYGSIFFILINVVKTKKGISALICVLIGMGLIQVVYGVIQANSISHKIWWWTNSWSEGWVTGTYINKNHLAGFLEMVIPLSIGLVIAGLKVKSRRTLERQRASTSRLRNWFSTTEEQAKVVLLSFFSIILGLGLLLTGSRGGIVSFGISMFVMAMLFFLKRGYRRCGIVVICMCLAILTYSLQTGIEKTVKRFEHVGSLHDRLKIAGSGILMIQDFPLLGIGWGNFSYVYPRYAIAEYPGHVSISHAHNDWIEAAAELGVLGISVIIVAFVVYIATILRFWFRERDRFAVGVGAGLIAGVVSIGIHSLFDFNMHIPANPMVLSSILAIGVVSSHTKGRSNCHNSLCETKLISTNGKGRLVVVASFVALVGSLLFQRVSNHFMAETKCPTMNNSTLNRDRNPPLFEIKDAIRRDPANAGYYYTLARHYIGLPIMSTDLKSKVNDEIINNLENALSLNPVNGFYWYDLGLRYTRKGREGTEFSSKWLQKADVAFERAISFRPNDPRLLHEIGRYWVWRSSTLLEAETRRIGAQRTHLKAQDQWTLGGIPSAREEGIEKFQALFRRTLEIDKKYWKRVVQRVWKYYPDENIVKGILPAGEESLGSRVRKWLASQS